jgi:HSP20 family protein
MVVQVRRAPLFTSLWEEIADLEREIERVFGTPVVAESAAETAWMPAVDMVENENETMLVAELPGVNKEDVKLSVENGVLTMSGSRKANGLPEGAGWIRNEIRRGDFHRSVRLPEGIQADKISATMANGILKIVLPKAEEVKPREIRVQ